MISRNNKKGLSEIVITLIMIVLVLVAISIVWFIVRGILDKGAGQVNLGADCLELDINAIKVLNTTDDAASPVTYNVTLSRGAGGGTIGGVKILFTNDVGDTNSIYDAVGNIAPLETKTISTGATITITEATQVEVVPYFPDKQPCSTSTFYEF